LGNPVVQVFGDGEGTVNIPSNSDIVIQGRVGNGRVEFALNDGGSRVLEFSSTFDVNGDGTRENRTIRVVQNNQLFSAGSNFTLVAALDASVAIFPFGNKTLFSCTGGLQNGQFQGCTALQ
jgi:hypothetical protein